MPRAQQMQMPLQRTVSFQQIRPGRWAMLVDGVVVKTVTAEEMAEIVDRQEAQQTKGQVVVKAAPSPKKKDTRRKARKRATPKSQPPATEEAQKQPKASESAPGGDGKEKQATAYVVYRPGDKRPDGKKRGPKDLTPEVVLGEALDFYRGRFEALPRSVACHPTWAEAVQAALAAGGGGYKEVEVVKVGGCLVPEIWLEVPDEPR